MPSPCGMLRGCAPLKYPYEESTSAMLSKLLVHTSEETEEKSEPDRDGRDGKERKVAQA
ncbi:MAG: hypothetical protein U1A78_37465 [Polyangia bacterium]